MAENAPTFINGVWDRSTQRCTDEERYLAFHNDSVNRVDPSGLAWRMFVGFSYSDRFASGYGLIANVRSALINLLANYDIQLIVGTGVFPDDVGWPPFTWRLNSPDGNSKFRALRYIVSRGGMRPDVFFIDNPRSLWLGGSNTNAETDFGNGAEVYIRQVKDARALARLIAHELIGHYFSGLRHALPGDGEEGLTRSASSISEFFSEEREKLGCWAIYGVLKPRGVDPRRIPEKYWLHPEYKPKE